MLGSFFVRRFSQQVFELQKEKDKSRIASGRWDFWCGAKIRELKPDFFVTLNGAYVER